MQFLGAKYIISFFQCMSIKYKVLEKWDFLSFH